MRHNNLHDGLSELASKDFTPVHVRDDPNIYTGRAVRGGTDNLKGSPSKDEGELKEDLLIRYLWMQGTDSIHNMRVVNTDATSYQSKSPEKCLETAKKAKKELY